MYMKWQKTNRSVARLAMGVALLPSPTRKTTSNVTTGKCRKYFMMIVVF